MRQMTATTVKCRLMFLVPATHPSENGREREKTDSDTDRERKTDRRTKTSFAIFMPVGPSDNVQVKIVLRHDDDDRYSSLVCMLPVRHL